jgi:hypothetical protein
VATGLRAGHKKGRQGRRPPPENQEALILETTPYLGISVLRRAPQLTSAIFGFPQESPLRPLGLSQRTTRVHYSEPIHTLLHPPGISTKG